MKESRNRAMGDLRVRGPVYPSELTGRRRKIFPLDTLTSGWLVGDRVRTGSSVLFSV